MIKVYNQSMQLVAYLENAFGIGYELPLNSLWTASFSLPANDPKNVECQPLRFVEVYDGDERVELFRIVPNTLRRSADGQTISYTLEHVLATLIDDVLFRYHTVGNLGYYTNDVIQYILSKQLIKRWSIGSIELNHQYEYNWENESLLAAIVSVPKLFTEQYQWTYDTTVYPWKLSLIVPSNQVSVYINYGVNMLGIERTINPTNICTRMYGLGYGEGVNQLTFSDINGGLPYIDSDTQAQYGVISRIMVDRRFESSEELKARCEAILSEAKQPLVTYSTTASDIHRLTEQRIYKYVTGAIVRVYDEELGQDFSARIVNVGKGDVYGNPGEVRLEIANKSADIAGTISDLANRQRISEVYAQGATNILSHDFTDNCDTENPAVLRFYIPEEAVRINKVMLTFDASEFWAYSKAIEGGGSFSNTVTSNNGGGDILTSGDSGVDVRYAYSLTESAGDPSHSHRFRYVSGHKHEIDLPSHSHQVDVVIPTHTHEIQYGIYKGPKPSRLTIRIDNQVTNITATSGKEIDIIPYLAKGTDGRVTRAAWHTIEITPNSLGRISATVFVQCFIQSRGGVDV